MRRSFDSSIAGSPGIHTTGRDHPERQARAESRGAPEGCVAASGIHKNDFVRCQRLRRYRAQEALDRALLDPAGRLVISLSVDSSRRCRSGSNQPDPWGRSLHLAVAVEMRRGNPIRSCVLEQACPAGGSRGLRRCQVRKRVRGGACGHGRIAGGNNAPILLVAEDVPDSTDVARHNRLAQRERFDHCRRKGLMKGGMDHDVRRGKDRERILPPTEQPSATPHS